MEGGKKIEKKSKFGRDHQNQKKKLKKGKRRDKSDKSNGGASRDTRIRRNPFICVANVVG